MLTVTLAALAIGLFYLDSRMSNPALQGIARILPRAIQEEKVPSEEKFRVQPTDEPSMPTAAEEAKRLGYLSLKGGGYQFEREDGTEGVAVPGTILMNRGAIELFACGAGGKEHESVVRIECDIHSLDSALTLCGLHRGGLPSALRDKTSGQGDRVVVLIQWKSKDERTVTHRAEDLVLDVNREAPMPRVGWSYVGTWAEVSDPMATPREKKSYKILAAASSRSLVTTWRDPSTLLDNPIPEAVNDKLYVANFAVAPPPGTPVLVIVRAPTKREREEIAKVEEELSK